MSGQYPLPSGYPPPGATYGMNQSPPVVAHQTSQPLPAGYYPPPMEAAHPIYPYDPVAIHRESAPAEVQYTPPVQALQPVSYPEVSYGAGASYSPAHIPLDGGYQASDALPYGIQPDMPRAQTAPKVSAGAEIDDPILRAEMEGAAAAMAAAKIEDPILRAEREGAASAQAVAEADRRSASTFPATVVKPETRESKVPPAAIDSRPFFLVSEHSEKCVLDVHKDNPKPGTAVQIYKKKTPNSPNQLWYIGADGLLRSKLSDLVIMAQGNHKEIKTAEQSGDVRQQWIIEGNKIVNKMFPSECLTVKKGLVRVKDDAEVMAASYEGKPTQHWKQVFVDE